MGLLVEGWGERERKKNEKLITLEARTKRESFGASLKKKIPLALRLGVV